IAHGAIPQALTLSGQVRDVDVEAVWFRTPTIGRDPHVLFAEVAAIWCVPGSPYANTTGALTAIRFARESGLPFLGTCGGFQHAPMEYAENLLHPPTAAHAEIEPKAPNPLIGPLKCELVEKTAKLVLLPEGRLRQWYRRTEVIEAFHCRYGLNEKYE